jgi:hypothetical protein
MLDSLCMLEELGPSIIVCAQGFLGAFIDNSMQEPKVARATTCHVSEEEYVVYLVNINAPSILRIRIWICTRPKCIYPYRR